VERWFRVRRHMTWRCKYKPDLTLIGQAANINSHLCSKGRPVQARKAGFPRLNRRIWYLLLVQNSLYIHGEFMHITWRFKYKPDNRRPSSEHQHHLCNKDGQPRPKRRLPSRNNIAGYWCGTPSRFHVNFLHVA